jgi:cytochrome c-type biogenesis protein CcmF
VTLPTGRHPIPLQQREAREMNLGDLLLKLATLSAAAATLLHARSLADGRKSRAGTIAFAVHAGALVASLLVLAVLFLRHRFEYAYVTQYSSHALSPALTLAALWAGQEGSVLLWAAIAAVLGLFLVRQPGSLAGPALFVVGASQLTMMLLLWIRSPFVLLPSAPPDGQGLNPLLEDPWMVVHPPALFIGYAAMLVPFALAVAALYRSDHRDWNRMAWPWTLFAVVTLGAGIALGGIWAYKTLGWGGYWAWDPVENASLIPWLLAVALLHGLLIQRTTGALQRTNYLLAALGWITTVGGTYMTRSGVLQDFSVHSFADSGLNAPLLFYLAWSTIVPAILLAARWRTLTGRVANWVSVSRESALWLGLMTLVVFAAMVAVGTTAPITTALAGRPAGVQASFYTRIAVPLGLALLLLMAVAPALRWTRQQGLSWLHPLAPGALAGAATIALLLPLGLRDPMWAAILFATGLALGINAWVAARLVRRGWMFGAGYVGHAGVAVMVLGIAVSTALGRSDRATLAVNEPVEVAGHRLTFAGLEQKPRGATELAIRVERGRYSFDARPRLLITANGVMRTPAIDGLRDLYLSPLEVKSGATHERHEPVWLRRGESVPFAGGTVSFSGFRMENRDRFFVFADLQVRDGDRTFDVAPALAAGADGSTPVPAEIPGIGSVAVVQIDADAGRVALHLPHEPAPAGPVAMVELSTRPLVNLVWIGALLTLLGSALAGVRRAAEPVAHAARAASRATA